MREMWRTRLETARSKIKELGWGGGNRSQNSLLSPLRAHKKKRGRKRDSVPEERPGRARRVLNLRLTVGLADRLTGNEWTESREEGTGPPCAEKVCGTCRSGKNGLAQRRGEDSLTTGWVIVTKSNPGPLYQGGQDEGGVRGGKVSPNERRNCEVGPCCKGAGYSLRMILTGGVTKGNPSYVGCT